MSFSLPLYACPYIPGCGCTIESDCTIKLMLFPLQLGTLIVHEAWDEPDSQYPNGRNALDSLYTSGQEAEISISEPILEDEIITQRDYGSDNSLLHQLASLAVCIGMEYVKINSDSNTISVAVRKCFDGNTR